MRIWCGCTKRTQSSRRIDKSPFANQDGCDYSYSEEYLGAKAIVNIYSQNIVLTMSYSLRDGILVNIKKNCPYRVVFDYVDGSYYVNDNRDGGYGHLAELLLTLGNQTSGNHHMKIYKKLEELMFEFVMKFYVV